MQEVWNNFVENIGIWWIGFQENIPNLITAVLIFIIGFYLAKFARKVTVRTMERRKADKEITILTGRIVRWTVIVFALIFGIQQTGQEVSALLAGLGILGFTVGFALKDVSANFVAGMLLLIQQPFDIDDTIEVSGYTGTVINVDLRSTELITLDGRHILIPNSDVFTNTIINYTRTKMRRISLPIGVGYDADLEMVEKLACKTVAQIPGVLTDPAPAVFFDGFGDFAMSITVAYWYDTGETGLAAAKNAGIVAVKKAFEDAGIDMPYPTQAVIVRK
jgi:small-conductance mechanosensitive channel